VVITTETAGTLRWTGSLQLNPLRSAGHAALSGSDFPLASAYLRHQLGFDIVQGNADVDFDYSIDTAPDGGIHAAVDDFNFAFRDVLVQTFTPANPDADREVLALPAGSLRGGALRWPEQRLSVASLTIDDAAVSVHRDTAGTLNIIRNAARATPQAEAAAAELSHPTPQQPDEPPAGGSWQLSLQQLAVGRLRFALEDESVEPIANIGIESLDLTVGDLSNTVGARFPTALSMRLPSGGSATATGDFALLPQPSLGFDVTVDDAALDVLDPYVRPLADVNLTAGTLDFTGRLSRDEQEPLAVSGNLAVDDFLITEADEGSRLGSWSRLQMEQIAVSASNRALDISELRLQQPYGDILIAADGSVNLGRVRKGTAGDSDAASREAPTGATVEPVAPAWAVTIGRVPIANGSADFQDQSLPLPFAANITELNGDITTIATGSREPSTVSLEGKVDEYGLVRVSGTVTPLDPNLDTDLHVAFQNVEMPKFSAYTIPFAGREIASGRLDLDLGYQVKASSLVGENRVILRDFELGEEVEHPGAMSLPLGLAVALLKDREGKIDIDLPVRGNVDDPEFRYGRVILTALGNLIVRIVASPFALLGNLLGVEASELEYISFLPGRADLTPPEMERIAKLAEALALRPELSLQVAGIVGRDPDGLALRTTRLQQMVDLRIAAAATTDESTYAERQTQVLEALFVEQGVEDAQRSALQALKLRFTTMPAANETSEEPQVDSLAYAAEIRRQLIELQTVTDDELAVLANERATNTRAAILQIDAALDARVVGGDIQSVESRPDEPIRMQVTLKAGAGEQRP
jgi:hypothetical protein